MKIKRYIILLVLVQINVQVYAQVVNKYGQQVLENVQNTLDANKPISTATQTALDLKAAIASPTFTGTPTLPTGNNWCYTSRRRYFNSHSNHSICYFSSEPKLYCYYG